MSKTSTALNAALLSPKSKQILLALAGHKLVIAQKETVTDPTDNKEKRMYVYDLTPAGKKAVKTLQID
jgi:hypothetical protein